MRAYRVYALANDVESLRRARPELFSHEPVQFLGELILAGEKGKRAGRRAWRLASAGQNASVFALGQWFNYRVGEDPVPFVTELREREDVLGMVFRRRKSERLEFWFRPRSPEVLEALAQNFARFLELLDEHELSV